MSSSEEEGEAHNALMDAPRHQFEEADEDTLRILLSTDNHLGYLETDPVRGMDSFAAFEEVLYLAKKRKCDMVLLAGDLFHDNKPSRRTLHKTIDIMRRYCMGHDPVKIQILSDQAQNFRSLHGTVNYEDECYSVDLPVFSIHGNHDDPTREGGTEMLAALDILSISNLCNYFGRQDEINRVEISPILIQKGATKVALYGMGSMRDERLNRMWQSKKVRFLRPDGVTEDEQEEDSNWFNIFALHQNRDTGRGSKNCVHESFLPPWLDFVLWGHEHESVIEPCESVVGTFRISQPGSSVATSLVAGEAARKHVGILDIRQSQFRVEKIPLTMVRSFVTSDVSLSTREEKLDAEDPKIDDHITKLLEEEVKYQIHNARQKTAQLLADAEEAGNFAASCTDLKYTLEQRNQVLVRIRVEHSGFTTLSNQRFGARFVGDVANPTDVLLFHRSKATGKNTGSKKGKAGAAMDEPVAPDELQKVRVEDLVKESLDDSDQKLEVLKEDKLAKALEEFVEKAQTNAISDVATALLSKQVKKLVRSGEGDVKEAEEGMDDEEEAETGAKRKRSKGRKVDVESEEEKENQKRASKKSKSVDHNIDVEDSDVEVPVSQASAKSKSKNGKAKQDSSRSSGDISRFTVARSSQPQSRSQTSHAAKSRRKKQDDSDDDSDVVEAVEPPKPRSSPRRQRNGKVNYNVDLSDDEDEVMADEDFLDDEEEPPKKKASRKPTTSKKGTTKTPSRRGRATQDSFQGLDDDWGTASTDH